MRASLWKRLAEQLESRSRSTQTLGDHDLKRVLVLLQAPPCMKPEHPPFDEDALLQNFQYEYVCTSCPPKLLRVAFKGAMAGTASL